MPARPILDWPTLLASHNATRVQQRGGTTNKARLKHLRKVLSLVPPSLLAGDARSTLMLEFGVRDAVSLNFMAGLSPKQLWHGFDSFSGMPESDVLNTTKSWRRGQLTPTMHTTRRGAVVNSSSSGAPVRLPRVAPNVALYAGWFNDTLPPFLDSVIAAAASTSATASTSASSTAAAIAPPHVAFMHLDADIYESTYLALTSVCRRGLLREGTVLSFDEIFATGNLLEPTLRHGSHAEAPRLDGLVCA